MGVRLGELKAAVVDYATRFDAAVISCEDAAIVVREAAAIKHAAATIEALAATRAADARSWKAGGYRSAEEQLARATGTSVSGAREALQLGRRLQSQPEVADAARRGELSPTQASAITDAVTADPTAGQDLLAAARAGGSLADLKNRCADVKAAAVDLEARRQHHHRHRYLRAWTDADGRWRLSGGGNPEHGAQIMAALAPIAEWMFHHARTHGQREHPDAYRFDALVELARQDTSSEPDTDLDAEPGNGAAPESAESHDPGPGPCLEPRPDTSPPPGPEPGHEPGQGLHLGPTAGAGLEPSPRSGRATHPEPAPGGRRPRRPGATRPRRGAPVKLLVRVDLETLMRGFPIAGETCELVGFGPISVSTVNDLVTGGDPFVTAILTKGRQVVGVVHHGRHPNAWQRTALEWLYPTCAAQGCPTPAHHLQIDHRIDWAQTHITLLDWLDALCQHHHNQKSRDNWSLVDGIGKRAFVAPDDPRHPRNKPPP